MSNGIKIVRSRLITVENCIFKNPQYKGEGGNGYLYTLQSNDCLLHDCTAENGRHNFDLGRMHTSGNVITRCTTRNGALASDFHMFFSVANLFDTMTVEGDFLEAVYRGSGTVTHGVTTSQSVFWNTRGLSYASGKNHIVRSNQFGNGYVIGTRSPAATVSSDGFVEGLGQGDMLFPESLFEDQRRRRLDPFGHWAAAAGLPPGPERRG